MAAVFVGAVVLVPKDAEASVVSFIMGLINGPAANASNIDNAPTVDNSQNMTLLEPAVNINPNPTSATDLSVVGNSALETPTGPGGTTREVEEKIYNTDKVSIYVVRSGDSLAAIAQMFGVTSNTILWANDLKSSKDIKTGQELVILPISGIKYVVKKGDTLASIAKKYKGDVDEIKDFNNMPENATISVGDEIIIPDGEDSLTSSVTTSSSGSKSKPSISKSTSAYFIRPVKSGIKTQGLHGKYNSAVDIGIPVGSSVYAAAAGKVIVAKTGGYNGGYGNYIVIEHSNGMQSIYAHLSEVDVSAGTRVDQGNFIGKTGNTGNSTGPHLHFEILGVRNWNPIN